MKPLRRANRCTGPEVPLRANGRESLDTRVKRKRPRKIRVAHTKHGVPGARSGLRLDAKIGAVHRITLPRCGGHLQPGGDGEEMPGGDLAIDENEGLRAKLDIAERGGRGLAAVDACRPPVGPRRDDRRAARRSAARAFSAVEIGEVGVDSLVERVAGGGRLALARLTPGPPAQNER
jgi:hypothetical protein